MFLNTDNIKKKNITYNQNDLFFMQGDKKIDFENITSYFHKETRVTTNSVYEGIKLEFGCRVLNREDNIKFLIDSNKDVKYKTIYSISLALEKYRYSRLNDEYKATQKMTFETWNNLFDIVLEGESISINYKGEKSHYKPMKVNKITQQENIIIFHGNGRTQVVYVQDIADYKLFLELCIKIISIELNKNDSKLKSIFWKYFIIFIVVFGINGWFKLCCMDNEVIETTSILSSILLGVWAIIYPIQRFIIEPLNNRKREKELNNISNEDS